MTEFIDLAPGLWLWRTVHPHWEPEDGSDRRVTSTCVETGGEVAVIDALATPDGDPLWDRLDRRQPTMAVVMKPDHVRSIDLFAHRYPNARIFGPDVFHPDDVPEVDLTPVYPGDALPGGMVALYDGRGRNETPLWIPEHGVVVFSDALTALGGRLQVWFTPWHDERVVPAMRALLDLDFQTVIVSHGEPVHERSAFERAIKDKPYMGSP